MLKSQNRIRKDKEFKKVFRFSKPQVSNNLLVRSAKNGFNFSRFGFVISNKIDKRATRRNALKRRLRSLASLTLNQVNPGYDIIIMVRQSYSYPFDFEAIKKDFIDALKKSGVVK